MQIQYSKTGGKIIIDQSDWLGGLHPQFNTGNLVKPFNNAPQLAQMRSMNPFRFLGYASPAYNPVDVTGVSNINTLIRNGVSFMTAGPYVYMVDGAAKIQRLDLSSDTLTTPVTVTGTGVAQDDCVTYNIGTTQYLFVSYNTGTPAQGNIARMSSGEALVSDYLTNASYLNASGMTTNPHPMIVGYKDILYVGDGNKVQQLDGQTGANGTWSTGALTLPSDQIITGFAQIGSTQPYLVIFSYKAGTTNSNTYYRGQATAWFWDMVSQDITKQIDLKDNYVSGAFKFGSTVGCFTQGRKVDSNKQSKLKLYNGQTGEFDTLAIFDQNVPLNGGVDIVDNQINWLCADGAQSVIWSYGSPFPGIPAGLNKIGEGIGTSAGFLRTLTSTAQYAATGTTTSGGLQNLSSNYLASSLFSTPFAEPEFPQGMYGQVKDVEVFYGQTASGGRDFSLTINNKLATSTVISSVSSVTSANLSNKYTNDSSGSALTAVKFSALKANGSWGTGSGATDAPIISRIEINFDNVSINP